MFRKILTYVLQILPFTFQNIAAFFSSLLLCGTRCIFFIAQELCDHAEMGLFEVL